MGNQDARTKTAVTPVRVFVAVLAITAVAFVGLGQDAAFGASSNAKKACKSLDGLQDDLSELSPDISAGSFDGGAFKQIGNAFTKASKSAPGNVKGALKQLGSMYKSVGNADSAVEAGIQLSKNAQKYSKAVQKFYTFYTTKCAGSSSSSASSGSNGGTLDLAGESISLASSRCYLKEQTAAGQDIELTAQASGTNDSGEDVRLDFTRYAAGGQFEGDDISIDVGPLGSSTSYHGRLDLDTVERSGDTLSVTDAELMGDDGTPVTVSFEIEC